MSNEEREIIIVDSEAIEKIAHFFNVSFDALYKIIIKEVKHRVIAIFNYRDITEQYYFNHAITLNEAITELLCF